MGKKNSVITTILFVAVIMVFFAASLLKPDTYYSRNEKRYLAQKPEVSLKSIFKGSYTSDYEEYITDQFVLRDGFMKVKTLSEIYIGKRLINGVYLAADDYLIEAHLPSEFNEERWKGNADKMISFVRDMKAQEQIEEVSVMLVPTASVILRDKLPAFAVTFDQNQVIDYVASGVGESFVDVRQTLYAHKDEYIYYKTDHHWTTCGAFLAYGQWAQKLGMEPLSQENFTVRPVTDEFYGTLFAKNNYAPAADTIYAFDAPETYVYHVDYNMGQSGEDTLYDEEALTGNDQYTYFLKGNNAVVDIQSNVDNDRCLLIIKDSYAHCFAPFAANHFKRVVIIDMRYLKKPVREIVKEYEITDILVLYNVVHFADDINMNLLK